MPPTPSAIPEYFTTLSALASYLDAPHGVPSRPPPVCARAKRNGPQLLVCHDYKGGYNDAPDATGYTFNFWPHVDAFIYFSHYRVAPPPRSWIAAAHREGVLILGTLIFEHDESKPDVSLLTSPPPGTNFAVLLARLAKERGFDGWLLNVEVPLPGGRAHANALVEWVGELRRELGESGQVVWYDSVTDAGALAWQDRLCAANAPFFAAAGKLFTNYTWAAHYPMLSVQFARQSEFGSLSASPAPAAVDIYTGIDVWGRGTHGGGGFNVHAALDHVRDAGTSTALFAPAWTWESREHLWTRDSTEGGDDAELSGWEGWWREERRFWAGAPPRAPPLPGTAPPDRPSATSLALSSEDHDEEQPDLMPGFYPARCTHAPARPIAHFHPSHPAPLPFGTLFNPGVGRARFVRGARDGADGAWTDVGVQTFVLPEELCLDDAWCGGASVRLRGRAGFVRVRDVLLEDAEGAELVAEAIWKAPASVTVVPGFDQDDGAQGAEEEALPHGWRRSVRRVAARGGIVAFGVRVLGNDAHADVLLGGLALRRADEEGPAEEDRDWLGCPSA